jgi:hypothetical protein
MSARERSDWQALRDAGLVAGDVPESTRTPWYLQILLGVSAWIAAICLFGFLAVLFNDLLSNRAALIVLGMLGCAAAIALLRFAPGEFFAQAALPVSLVGQALIGLAAFDKGGNDAGGWIAVALVASVMYVFGPSWLHRFVCGAIVVIAACGFVGRTDPTNIIALLPLTAWAAALLWATDDERVAPLAWACGLGAFGVAAFDDFMFWSGIVRSGIGRTVGLHTTLATVAAMLLPAVALRLASVDGVPRSPPVLLLLVGSMALAILWLPAPGVAIGLAFALTGFALDRPAIVFVGLAGTVVYLVRYYYALEVTLLDKSGLLVASGLLVLALRRVAQALERRA